MHINRGFLSGGYNLGCNLRGANLQGVSPAFKAVNTVSHE